MPVTLNQVIEETVDLIKGQATRNKVSTTTVLDSKLPSVLGGQDAVEQVILNLVTNAIEAMTALRAGRATWRSGPKQPDDAQVRILSEDTGISVDPQLLPQLFEPFFTTRTHGLMGLPISRSIVEAHSRQIVGRICYK